MIRLPYRRGDIIYGYGWSDDRRYPGLRAARRRQAKQDQRGLYDMPPRGVKRAWEAAVRHGNALPGDSVGLWLCRGRSHQFFTVGPLIEWMNMLLIRCADVGRIGSNELRSVLCGCGAPHMRRVGLDRETSLAARAAWRLEGENGVWSLLQGRTQDPVWRPHFAVLEDQRYGETGHMVSRVQPTSMGEALKYGDRYKALDPRRLIIDDPVP